MMFSEMKAFYQQHNVGDISCWQYQWPQLQTNVTWIRFGVAVYQWIMTHRHDAPRGEILIDGASYVILWKGENIDLSMISLK